MKIIRKKSSSYLFRVLKPFPWGGRLTEPMQEIEMSPQEGLGAIQRGKVIPADIPEIGEYLALQDLTVSGDKEAFRAKKMEKILLKRDQAISLMLERKVIPVDEFRWRPYGLRLLKPGEAEAERRRIAALDKAAFEEYAAKIGILQKPK